MAYEVRLSKRALIDLRRIYKTIQAETSAAAERWFLGLEASIFSLEEQPARAPITQEDPNVHHLLYGNKPHVYRIMRSTKNFRLSASRRSVTVLGTEPKLS